MIFVLLNIVGFIGFSSYMALRPDGFADLIIRFSEKSWFHLFEIVTRAILGVGFLVFAGDTPLPTFFKAVGYVFIAVSAGLLVFGEKRHREYALWSASRFRNYFRFVGFVFAPLGCLFMFYLL